LEPDADGLVRAARSAWNVGGTVVPSVFDASSRLPPSTRMVIDFSILPSSFGSASFSDVLNGEIDVEAFRGKRVYIGATAVELRDAVPVPVHRVLPGVVVQALAAATLTEGAPRTPPSWLYSALLIAWTLGAAPLLTRP